jgi:hypothetical protein
MHSSLVCATTATLLLAAAALATAQTATDPLPDWETLRDVALQTLASSPAYRSGDLLARSDVTRVCDALRQSGWEPSQRHALHNDALSDTHPLVQQLRTAEGRRFMRRVASIPQGYDRLEHLLDLPDGRKTLAALIRGPDGHKFIAYLAQTPQGANLGHTLSRLPQGGGFNRPTGRIYTQHDLLQRLQQVYELDAASSGN